MVSAVAFLALVSLLLVQPASALASWPVVRLNYSGSNVKTVQYLLRYRGYSLTADGAFGPGTDSAVKQFQTANALTADGVVGANTWTKLVVTLDVGANNEAVRGLQEQLNKYGYNLTVDGAFGSGTQNAVNDFKTKHYLGSGSTVGPTTWQELTGSSAGGGTRAQLATTIRDSSRIGLATTHDSGNVDSANARQNIVDTANGAAARRSSYENAPGGSVYLDTRLLNGMITLSSSWSYFVTEIAGGSHSVGSRHYDGVAVDVGTINGSQVTSSNPYQSAFRSKCSSLGATEVLGPGDSGHSTHIHCAWPRP
jgi:peptidoglycan hydrolase-like protein with peptidoglycan-binding domain